MDSGRLGIYVGFNRKLPFEDRLRLIREAGFGATFLWWEERNPWIRNVRKFAPGLVRKHGLHLDNFHVPYYACRELWSSDRAARQESVALHSGWIDDCALHEVPRLVMHVCIGANTPEPSDDGLDSFRRLTERASERGVTLALENTRQERYLDYLFERVESPALGLCFDSSHNHLYGERPGALLNRWENRLAAVHLSDTPGKSDRHWLPGEGVVDFETLRPSLGEGFGGTYMLECVPKNRSEEADAFLARARDSLMNVLCPPPAARSAC